MSSSQPPNKGGQSSGSKPRQKDSRAQASRQNPQQGDSKRLRSLREGEQPRQSVSPQGSPSRPNTSSGKADMPKPSSSKDSVRERGGHGQATSGDRSRPGKAVSGSKSRASGSNSESESCRSGTSAGTEHTSPMVMRKRKNQVKDDNTRLKVQFEVDIEITYPREFQTPGQFTMNYPMDAFLPNLASLYNERIGSQHPRMMALKEDDEYPAKPEQSQCWLIGRSKFEDDGLPPICELSKHCLRNLRLTCSKAMMKCVCSPRYFHSARRPYQMLASKCGQSFADMRKWFQAPLIPQCSSVLSLHTASGSYKVFFRP